MQRRDGWASGLFPQLASARAVWSGFCPSQKRSKIHNSWIGVRIDPENAHVAMDSRLVPNRRGDRRRSTALWLRENSRSTAHGYHRQQHRHSRANFRPGRQHQRHLRHPCCHSGAFPRLVGRTQTGEKVWRHSRSDPRNAQLRQENTSVRWHACRGYTPINKIPSI